MKMVPAGVSRTTGKSYNAFEACSAKCGWKPPRAGYRTGAPQATYQTPPASPSVAADMLNELQEIKAILLLMNSKLPKVQTVKAPVETDAEASDDALKPDEEIPF